MLKEKYIMEKTSNVQEALEAATNESIETEEAEIVIRVRNCDGEEVNYKYPELEDLKVEWHGEHECPIIPMLDDKLLFASVEGKEIKGETAEDVFRYLKEKYGWEY